MSDLKLKGDLIMKSKIFVMVLVLAMLVPFSVSARTVVTMWVYDEMAASPDLALVRAQQEFMEMYPDIEIRIENTPHRGLLEKIITSSMVGVAADVIHVATTWPVELAAMQLLAPLDAYLEESGKIHEINASAFASSSFNGNIYAVPWMSDATALIYNKTMFEEAGLDLPSLEQPYNWDEFLAVAQALTMDVDGDGRIDQYGFGIRSGRGAAYGWFPFLFANDGQIINKEGTEIVFNSPEGLEAFEYYTSLFTEHQVVPPGAVGYDRWDDVRNAFLGGRVAMYIAGDWEIEPLRSAEPNFEFGVAPHPMQKRRATSLGGSSLAISAGSNVKDEAFLWIDFLTDREQMGVVFEYGRFSARVDAADSEFVTDPLLEVFIREFPYGINHASIVGDQTRNELAQAFEEVMVGNRNPKQALDAAAARLQAQLDDILQAQLDDIIE